MTHPFEADKSSSHKKPMFASSLSYAPTMTQQSNFYSMGHTQNYLGHYNTAPQASTSLFVNSSPSYLGMHHDVSAQHYSASSSSSSTYRPVTAPLPRMQKPEPFDSDLGQLAQWQTSSTPSDFQPYQTFTPHSGGLYPSPDYFSNASAFVSPPLSQISTSPSSSPSQQPLPHLPNMERRPSVDSAKSCSHCHVTSTPLWRREPGTLRPLCNACGLYLQQRNRHRPQELIDADNDDESDVSGDGTGPECSHCHTHNTSVWRRSKTGDQLCNACGVYSRLKGKDRPLSLKRNKIKPRSKHSTSPSK